MNKASRKGKKARVCLPILGLILLAALLFLLSGKAQELYERAAYPMKYEELITRYAKERGLPASLVFGVVHTESGFDPEAVSVIGARGLMQITEETFEWAKGRMGDEETVYDDLFDEEANVRYGTYILKILIEEFDTPQTALAAYHAGWGSVKRWLADARYSDDGENLLEIPFKDTAWYVPRVLESAHIYERLYQLEGK